MIIDQLNINSFSNYTGRVDVEQVSNELAMHWLKTMEQTDEAGSFIATDIPVAGIREHLEETTGYRLKYIGKPYCA